jgi:hypothetical protein
MGKPSGRLRRVLAIARRTALLANITRTYWSKTEVEAAERPWLRLGLLGERALVLADGGDEDAEVTYPSPPAHYMMTGPDGVTVRGLSAPEVTDRCKALWIAAPDARDLAWLMGGRS